MPPTMGNGKICYMEIPATDIPTSAAFYTNVFGWKTRKRGDGATAFDDGVGQVSGTWVLGRSAIIERRPAHLRDGRRCRGDGGGDRQEWRNDRSADRRRCAGDHGALSRSGWQRARITRARQARS